MEEKHRMKTKTAIIAQYFTKTNVLRALFLNIHRYRLHIWFHL